MTPLLALALLAGPLPQAPPAAPDPAALLRGIQERGAEAVLADVYEDDARWRAVLNGIASGSRGWLLVAQRLKPAARNAAEELTVALARALEKEPANVLAILGEAFDVDDVCSLNTLEESLGTVYAAAVRTVERRQRAVSRVTDPRLRPQRAECLAFLGELRREVIRNRQTWFEPAASR